MIIPFSAGKQTMHISIEYYNLYASKCIQKRFLGHKTTKNSYKIQTIHFDDWTSMFTEYWSKFWIKCKALSNMTPYFEFVAWTLKHLSSLFCLNISNDDRQFIVQRTMSFIWSEFPAYIIRNHKYIFNVVIIVSLDLRPLWPFNAL